ncbi:hypothetical protein AtDm6_1779 [Acetobacter tropicalis]|uniref:Uncharacterized protein n=1 Tax=Acetobacter tropicalis TaxID=104102 RepID=A0A094ZL66_9PROT|nr:hypothetical protein AtDm6_1779 [Acetobacter tropicalis]
MLEDVQYWMEQNGVGRFASVQRCLAAQGAAPEQTRFILIEYRRILTVVYLQNVTTS